MNTSNVLGNNEQFCLNVFGVGVPTCVEDYLHIEKMEITFAKKENLWERFSSLIAIPRHLATTGLRCNSHLSSSNARTALINGVFDAS